MKKQEILDTLAVVDKQHVQQAIDKLDRGGVPGNRGSYIFDIVDSDTGKKYPPPYLIETAYKIATGKKLPKGFFDSIKNNGPHFQKVQELGYQIETKWYDDLDLSSKIFSYKWLYTISASQWSKALDAGKMILSKLDIIKEDSKLVISFRDDAKQRMGLIIGSALVGGFYLEKGVVYLNFFVNQDFDISTDPRLSLYEFKFSNNIGKLIYLKLDDWQGEKDPLNKQVLSDIADYYKEAPGTSYKNSHLPFMTDVIRHSGPRKRFISFITQKPQVRLLDIYKYYLKTTGNLDELYKWELGKLFKDNWDLNANDFGAMLTSVKFENLLSQQSGAFYREARKNPEDAKVYFKHIFNESISKSDRIEWAKDEGTKLMKKWHPRWTNSGQDERTLSVFWAFNDLSNHAPYKSSFYTKYCELLETPIEKAGKKYEHYLSLINDLVENYIKKDKELLTLHKKTIDIENHIDDPNYHLLSQNLLYRILDGYWTWELKSNEETKMNYKEAFTNWLDKTNSVGSGMISSYLRAMELLNGVLKYEIYEESDTNKLHALYKDLIDNQGDPDGIYLDASAPSYGSNGYYSAAINKYISFHEQLNNSGNMSKKTKSPINQILYGPPGTGKTYNTVNYALSIIENRNIKDLQNENREAVLERYNRNIEDGKIVFTTFHQSMSYEDFIEGIKPEIDDETENVKYTIQNGIFKKLCMKASLSKHSDKNFEESYEKLKETIKDNGGSLVLETLVRSKEFTVYINSKGNIKFHPNTEKAHEAVIRKDFINHYLKTGETLDWSSYLKSLANYMIKNCGYVFEGPEMRNNQNFVVVIDEINRGNVSAIFGELITLIEEDKRKGNKEEIQVTLPYSKQSFSVPKNLNIIGTMNTADRSVEALDTALRRRFSFIEMLPDSTKLTKTIEGIELSKLLTTLNERVEVLVDRDHTIGHAFFMNLNDLNDLRDTFANKVIPLLQEYFYGDYGKMEMVIGSAFFIVKDTSKVKFAVKSDDFDPEGKIYQIIDIANKEEFSDKDLIEALTNLIKGQA